MVREIMQASSVFSQVQLYQCVCVCVAIPHQYLLSAANLVSTEAEFSSDNWLTIVVLDRVLRFVTPTLPLNTGAIYFLYCHSDRELWE